MSQDTQQLMFRKAGLILMLNNQSSSNKPGTSFKAKPSVIHLIVSDANNGVLKKIERRTKERACLKINQKLLKELTTLINRKEQMQPLLNQFKQGAYQNT